MDNDRISLDLGDLVFNKMCKNIKSCNYYNLTNSLPKFYNSQNFITMLHLNIRSLNKNYDDFYDFITALPQQPDILCLSETQLKGEPLKYISISGY